MKKKIVFSSAVTTPKLIEVFVRFPFCEVPHPHKGGAATYRPRSGRVFGNEKKIFRNRSAALRFTLSPSEIDGDVSFSTIYLIPSATVVAERLCFHMCLSVHKGKGSVLDRHQADYPPGRQTPPWADTPQQTVRIVLECILIKIASTTTSTLKHKDRSLKRNRLLNLWIFY